MKTSKLELTLLREWRQAFSEGYERYNIVPKLSTLRQREQAAEYYRPLLQDTVAALEIAQRMDLTFDTNSPYYSLSKLVHSDKGMKAQISYVKAVAIDLQKALKSYSDYLKLQTESSTFKRLVGYGLNKFGDNTFAKWDDQAPREVLDELLPHKGDPVKRKDMLKLLSLYLRFGPKKKEGPITQKRSETAMRTRKYYGYKS